MASEYKYKSRRKKVDWDAEIEKTERIKRRGLFMSGLSFALACVLIFGMGRTTGTDIELPKSVLTALCFFVSCVIFGVVMKRRAKKKQERQEQAQAREKELQAHE